MSTTTQPAHEEEDNPSSRMHQLADIASQVMKPVDEKKNDNKNEQKTKKTLENHYTATSERSNYAYHHHYLATKAKQERLRLEKQHTKYHTSALLPQEEQPEGGGGEQSHHLPLHQAQFSYYAAAPPSQGFYRREYEHDQQESPMFASSDAPCISSSSSAASANNGSGFSAFPYRGQAYYESGMHPSYRGPPMRAVSMIGWMPGHLNAAPHHHHPMAFPSATQELPNHYSNKNATSSHNLGDTFVASNVTRSFDSYRGHGYSTQLRHHQAAAFYPSPEYSSPRDLFGHGGSNINHQLPSLRSPLHVVNSQQRHPMPGFRSGYQRNASPTHANNVNSGSYQIKDMTLNELRPFFNKPILLVAKEFGVCITLMKKICRKNGIQRWPHRRIRSLVNRITSSQVILANTVGPERKKLMKQIDHLRAELSAVIQDPNVKAKPQQQQSLKDVEAGNQTPDHNSDVQETAKTSSEYETIDQEIGTKEKSKPITLPPIALSKGSVIREDSVSNDHKRPQTSKETVSRNFKTTNIEKKRSITPNENSENKRTKNIKSPSSSIVILAPIDTNNTQNCTKLCSQPHGRRKSKDNDPKEHESCDDRRSLPTISSLLCM